VLQVGARKLQAVYVPDAPLDPADASLFVTSSSTIVDHVVAQATTTTTLTAIPTLDGRTATGQLTLTADVSVAAGATAPAGLPVVFSADGKTVGTASLVCATGASTCVASAATDQAVPGTKVTAQFQGDATYASSSSGASDVPPYWIATTVVTGPPSSTAGGSVTITATVTPSWSYPVPAANPTGGMVVFYVNDQLYSADLVNGVATKVFGFTTIGTYPIRAQYVSQDGIAPALYTAWYANPQPLSATFTHDVVAAQVPPPSPPTGIIIIP
jgi:hypothetical protein